MFDNKPFSQFLCCAYCVAYLVTCALIRVPTNFISVVILLWDNRVSMLRLVSFSVTPATIGYECHMPISFVYTVSSLVLYLYVLWSDTYYLCTVVT